jgi:hypothetical protein
VEGKGPLYLSLDNRFAPLARLPEYLEGGKALRLSKGGQEIVQLPPGDPDRSAMRLRGTLKLGEASDVDAEMELSSESVVFSSQRESLKNLPTFQRDMALRALASGFFPGAKCKSAEIRNLDDPEKPMVIALDLTAPKMLRARGEEMLLRAVIRPSQMVRRFAGRSEREHPFQLMAQIADRDSVRVNLGGSFKLLRSPSDVVLASALGTYSLTFKAEGDALVVSRSLTLSPGRIAPQDFPAFVEFARKVDAAEQESLVLKKG